MNVDTGSSVPLRMNLRETCVLIAFAAALSAPAVAALHPKQLIDYVEECRRMNAQVLAARAGRPDADFAWRRYTTRAPGASGRMSALPSST
jgi:hypothetical protein